MSRTAARDVGERTRRVPVSITSVVDVLTLATMVTAVFLRGGQGWAFPGTPLLVFTVLGWVPLLVRTRWPLAVLAATTLVSAAQLLLVPLLDHDWETPVGMAAYQPVPIAVAVAAFTVAARERRTVGLLAGLAAAVVLPLVAWASRGAPHVWTDLVMFNLILDGTAAGALVAGRRDRLAREAREQAERTRREVEAERLRIARELHDVLAHHLTLVNAQAGVADYLVRTDPDAAAQALHGMTRHTRQALDELRATVGLLRELPQNSTGETGHHDDSAPNRPPLPTLDRLPQLLQAVRAAGADVTHDVDGRPRRLSPGVDLAAYRVVQESLTNATKHAPGAPVTVELTWRDRLQIRISNPVEPSAAPEGTARPVAGGHGLVGMTERVRAAGGTLTIQRPGRRTSDTFVVTVELPTDQEDPSSR